MAQSVKWAAFNDLGEGACGYCGFDPEDEFHYCDGFGRSVEIATGKVHGDHCHCCKSGRFCEKAWDLEHPGEPLPEPVYEVEEVSGSP